MCCKSSGKWKPCGPSASPSPNRQQQQLPPESASKLSRQTHWRTFRVPILVLILLSMLLQLQTAAAGVGDSLHGDLLSCSVEGEEVLTGIQNSKCFKCICQNGFVNCAKSCPAIDDCYLLESKLVKVASFVGCLMRVAPSGATRRIPAKRTSASPVLSPRQYRSVIHSATTTSYRHRALASAVLPVRVARSTDRRWPRAKRSSPRSTTASWSSIAATTS
ncbi:uncharacterized protein LOC117193460 isoform X2 [Drosophila miranda]|uniref:uncharacterized protein LOC117193460 isoform X2 n=1 Tax=Drosophila miranda TaxID=7229 RepID=UPI00143F385F|nr:uncharacterized protein LOC117193460 isoform X2 [Drosophila miranda]